MDFYERALGVSFLPPLESRYPRVVQSDGEAPFTARMTYSRGGPVHLELVEVVEAAGTGLWAGHHDHQVHHVGMWCPDPRSTAADLVTEGFEWEADCCQPDGSVPVVFVRRGGYRLELVTEARRPRLTDWVAGRIASPR